MISGRRSTMPGLFELLQEADLSQFYNELRSSLRVCHVQQLKDVNEDDLVSIGLTKTEAQRLKSLHNKYCPPNYVTKLKKLLLPAWSGKDEFLLDEHEVENVPSPPSTCGQVTMPFPDSMTVIQHQGMEIKVPRQHLISPESIKIHKELGNGEFGVVQQGVLIDNDQVTRQVAIKSLSKERMQNSTVEFMKEYEIMQTIRHENIVTVFGVVLETSPIMIITELAPLRSLLECLKEPDLRSTLTVPCLALFSRQICAGMKYLESRRLIHRDLAARNILVFSKSLVKISDFGLSRALGVDKNYYQTNFNMNLKLPIAWCAPECITFLQFSSASDVWAFAVTMWEMFSYGFQPWAALTGQQILDAIDVPNRKRLERPRFCPSEYYQIMLKCWHHEKHQRPTFAQLCSILDEARPEQVRATMQSSTFRAGFLDFDVGNIITVLDKNLDGFWNGVRDDTSHVGLFSPSLTVTHLGTIPKSSFINNSSSSFNIFNSSLKRETNKQKRLSREMISSPSSIPSTNDFYHHHHQNSIQQNSKIDHRRADSETSSDMTPLISNLSHVSAPTKPANRMGHAIGYVIRDKNPVVAEKHEYHSISDEAADDDDDDFSKPLDLGPSFMDEVFSELGTASSKDHDNSRRKDLKGLVSNTLNIRKKKKQLATVKPIKASDQKALESAIAMANALASKSMHDIDKRSSFDHWNDGNGSPGRSPITPNSPSKKFTFFFPSSSGSKTSPKVERKPFLESRKFDIALSDQEKQAYDQLVGECESLPPLTKLSSPSTMISQSMACLPTTNWSDQHDHFLQLSPPPTFPAPSIPVTTSPAAIDHNNALPLPPRSHTLSRANLVPPKRHVRKNPLIVPSARVSNLIRNENTVFKSSSDIHHQKLVTDHDAFETALEQNIDALDNIGGEGGEESLFIDETQTDPGQYFCEDREFGDEVRIMMKVLDRADPGECRRSLQLTKKNMHHAIKLVKLKKLIKAHGVTDADLLATLISEGWDVAKAASCVMKRLQ